MQTPLKIKITAIIAVIKVIHDSNSFISGNTDNKLTTIFLVLVDVEPSSSTLLYEAFINFSMYIEFLVLYLLFDIRSNRDDSVIPNSLLNTYTDSFKRNLLLSTLDNIKENLTLVPLSVTNVLARSRNFS